MKKALEGLGIAVALILAVSFLVFIISKGVQSLEDLRVVEVKPGIECAIVSRIAHTSIDCWKQGVTGVDTGIAIATPHPLRGEDLLMNRTNDKIVKPSLSFGDGVRWVEESTIKIEPMYNQRSLVRESLCDLETRGGN